MKKRIGRIVFVAVALCSLGGPVASAQHGAHVMDYFCTVLLAYLSRAAGDELVFKGGTCLTKIHSELYRLSLGASMA